MNSTHTAEVFQVNEVKPHPNADRLEIIEFEGYQTCVKKGDFKAGDLAVFIPPDTLVDTSRSEFLFLADKAKDDGFARIKAMKLRGSLSFGMLVKAPQTAKVGDDLYEHFGLQHYNPVERKSTLGGVCTGGDVESPPNIYHPKYDVDAFRRYAKYCFEEGESVVITEKVHGCNCKFVYHDGKMYCGSRNEWKREYPDYSGITIEKLIETSNGKIDQEKAQIILDNLLNKPKSRNFLWDLLDTTPSIEKFCRDNPYYILYGEAYGAIQDLNYGCKKGGVKFVGFDIMHNGHWLEPFDCIYYEMMYNIPWVPRMDMEGKRVHGIVYNKYDFDLLCQLAEGNSLVPGANHIREGIVVSPLYERIHPSIGRVKLKLVSSAYLER